MFRAKGLRVVTRWKLGTTAKSLLTWRKNTKEEVKMRLRVQEACFAWRKGVTKAHFRRWNESVAEIWRLKGRSMMVVQRWMRRSLSAAVGRWLYQSCKQQQLRFKMWKVIQRWGSIAIASSFEAWRAEYQLIKVVQYVVIKWYKVRTSQGFGRWQEYQHNLRRLSAVAGKIVLRWKTNAKKAFWVHWKAVIGDLKRLAVIGWRPTRCREISHLLQRRVIDLLIQSGSSARNSAEHSSTVSSVNTIALC